MHGPAIATPVTDPAEELFLIEEEIRRRRYLKDNILWAEEKLGDVLWSGQKRIFRSVANNRRTAIRSCHEIGKSFSVASLASWWLDIHPVGEAFVVTSAPTASQVRAILWREIGRVHTRGNLKGRVNQAEWFMTPYGGKEELVAFGRKPDDFDPTALQGIHAPRVMVIFDEACGMALPLWEAGDSLIANDLSKMVVIGNPDDPATEFANVCKPGSGWHVIGISAFDSPNFTGEPMPEKVLQQLIGKTYVEEKRRKWAPEWRWTEDGSKCIPPEGQSEDVGTNPLWQSKVLGKFPERADSGGLIPISWILRAQRNELESSKPNHFGVDVGAGGDSSTICHRRGGVFRIIHEDHNPDTMQTTGKVVELSKKLEPEDINVDTIGIGKGMCDRSKELVEENILKKAFVAVNVGTKSNEPDQFINLRADGYWQLREAFERGEIDLDPNDEDTAAELVELRYKRLSSGKIQMESKDQMKARGVKSPNRAEAIMLANLKIKPKVHKATW